MLIKEWIKQTIAIATLIILTIFTINVVIDPYGIFDLVKIEKLNKLKPSFSTHLRLAKAFKTYKVKPLAVAFGTSRAEFGISMSHPGWDQTATPRYNLAVSDANIYEIRRLFEHSIGIAPVKQAVFMLDFMMFDANRANKDDFDESILSYKSKFTSPFIYALSLNMLLDSVKTVVSNRVGYMTTAYLDTGERDVSKDRSLKIEHHKSFIENEKRYIKVYANHSFFYNDKQETYKNYQAIIEDCYQNNIDCIFAISPSHARQWEALDVALGYSVWEQWKKRLTQINENVAKQQNKSPFALWDFSGYSLLTTEEVPPKGDTTTRMKYYYESSHYKKELGDILLDRIFDSNSSGGQDYPDFGVKLTSQNIDSHLAKLRAEREKWRSSHPVDVAEIEALKKR
jgi:hypothetical protein